MAPRWGQSPFVHHLLSLARPSPENSQKYSSRILVALTPRGPGVILLGANMGRGRANTVMMTASHLTPAWGAMVGWWLVVGWLIAAPSAALLPTYWRRSATPRRCAAVLPCYTYPVRRGRRPRLPRPTETLITCGASSEASARRVRPAQRRALRTAAPASHDRDG